MKNKKKSNALQSIKSVENESTGLRTCDFVWEGFVIYGHADKDGACYMTVEGSFSELFAFFLHSPAPAKSFDLVLCNAYKELVKQHVPKSSIKFEILSDQCSNNAIVFSVTGFNPARQRTAGGGFPRYKQIYDHLTAEGLPG